MSVTFLGIDLGTSALKAVLVDSRQAVLAESTVRLPISYPRPGWSEQDPEDWWRALAAAMATLRAENPSALRSVRALGLSGQMHGAVLVDGSGGAVRPAILWNDGRAAAECALLEAAVPGLARIAGVGAMPGFTAPKLIWLARHEPASLERLWKVLSPKDFLRLRLTGRAATDMSDAAGTMWLDQAARDWSDPVLKACGLTRVAMPDLVEGSAASGEVVASTLGDWGIEGPVVVAGGAGDAAAAAIGIGAVRPGDAFISLGTSAQLFMTEAAYAPPPQPTLHSFAHALPGRWFRMAAMLNGAACLDWVARLVRGDIPDLLRQVEAEHRAPSRVLFLPYLSGERTPHDDPNARGVFFGLDSATTSLDLVQATLEGVAFSLLEARLCLEGAGAVFHDIAAVGGGARSRFWMQLVAHVLGRVVVLYAGADKGPAFGAARLARIALTAEEAEAVCTKPSILARLEPDPALNAAYQERFARFRTLYAALRSEFRPASPPAVDSPPLFR